MSGLPDRLNTDYMVYSISNSIIEEEKIWNMPYVEVFKRMMFKKFDGWVEKTIMEEKKNE